MEIYTKGIFIRSVRFQMWVAKSGDSFYGSHRLHNLEKHLADPAAKLGVWVDIGYTIQKNINSTKRAQVTTYVDISNATYTSGIVFRYEDGQGPTGRLEVIGKGQYDDKVIEAIIPLYLEKWKKRLQKESKNAR